MKITIIILLFILPIPLMAGVKTYKNANAERRARPTVIKSPCRFEMRKNTWIEISVPYSDRPELKTGTIILLRNEDGLLEAYFSYIHFNGELKPASLSSSDQ